MSDAQAMGLVRSPQEMVEGDQLGNALCRMDSSGRTVCRLVS
jgi:hypothetical protein